MKKKKFIIIGIILIIGVVGFIGFKVVNKVMLDKEIANFIEEVEANGETYLVIEINPKIILILDENNKVKEISNLIEDARIF
ncbi:MAG: hypothetical protein K2G03_07425, partial [Bacilli bacterium]|nr:hypothetical protein [Bacilli bacterium]